MYEQHWRLSRPAFRSSSPVDFFYPGRSHAAAVLKLRYLVEQQQGIAVLTGPSGIGKTCVLEAFCADLPDHCGPIVQVLYPQFTASELLGFLTSKLEAEDGIITPSSDGLDHVLQRLEQQLLKLTRSGRHALIVIDDAHLISDRRALQTLQLLLNYRRVDHIEFSVVLAGQPELIGQVRRHAALLDRMAFISTLTPLDLAETQAYVRHRLQAAGGMAEIFDDEALAAVHEHSGGLPRRISRLCDFALLVGYADNVAQITPSQIEAVAEELSLAA